MSSIAQKLWNNDVNKIPLMDVSLNYQGQTTLDGTTDMAATKYVNIKWCTVTK
jgi:hypothetical protein